MTGPKHLWSGNWQQESADPPRDGHTPARANPTPPPVPATPRSSRSPRDLLRKAAPLLAAIVVVGVAATVLAIGSGSASHKPASRAASTGLVPNPATPTPTIPGGGAASSGTPANTITGRTVNWLGMQISTVQGVGAVIQTVQLGTPADTAGLDPGDVIQTINGHSIAAADQIATAVKGLRQGDAVGISVERGSTLFTTVAPFDGHPTTSP